MTPLGWVFGAALLLWALGSAANDTGRRWRIQEIRRQINLPRRRAGGIGFNRRARR